MQVDQTARGVLEVVTGVDERGVAELADGPHMSMADVDLLSPGSQHDLVFRERLVPANVEQQIFAEVRRQLQRHGFRVREGLVIDASIVRAPIQHTTADEQVYFPKPACRARSQGGTGPKRFFRNSSSRRVRDELACCRRRA